MAEVWNKANCCPYTQKHIVTLFEKNVWDKYSFLLREKRLLGDENTTKRSHKKDPSKHKDRRESTRRSRRIQSTVEVPTKNELVQIIPHLLIVVSRQQQGPKAY